MRIWSGFISDKFHGASDKIGRLARFNRSMPSQLIELELEQKWRRERVEFARLSGERGSAGLTAVLPRLALNEFRNSIPRLGESAAFWR